jgi:hypothetical protein
MFLPWNQPTSDVELPPPSGTNSSDGKDISLRTSKNLTRPWKSKEDKTVRTDKSKCKSSVERLNNNSISSTLRTGQENQLRDK